MLTQVTKKIEQFIIPFPGGMGSVNSYLIRGKKGYTVIDTGWNHPAAIEKWEKFIKTSSIPMEKVVLTHVHQDHIGLAKWFQQEKGIPVFVSDVGYEEMKKHLDLTYDKFNRFITMHGGPNVPKQLARGRSIYDFEPDGIFSEEEKIQLGDDEYEAILTPGHAPDQFCFYNEEERIMIVGDHILSNLAPVIGLWTAEEGNPLKDYFQSLQKVKHYTPIICLPGHGEIIHQFHERVDEIEKRHENRLEQVYSLTKNEWKTASQICEDVYGESNGFDHISPFMAILTRLIYLESVGRLERRTIDGKIMFSKAQ